MARYRTVFTRQALDFICRASDEEIHELDAWLDRIEAQPGLTGDYAETGDVGRELQVICLHQVVVTYWTDHAIREVRVMKIEPNA
jgi:hypothetical protein